jgi:hypothetical protein
MNLQNQNISPITLLLFIHVISLSYFFQSELSDGFKNYVNKSPIIKQLIIFITILSIVAHVYTSLDYVSIIFMSFTLYIILLLLSKTPHMIHIIAFILLALYHFYEMNQRYKETIYLNSNIVTVDEKNKLINYNVKKNMGMLFLVCLVIIGGSLMYESKKEKKFGNEFKLNKFLFRT